MYLHKIDDFSQQNKLILKRANFEMFSFELILDEVLDRNYGDDLKIPMVIMLPREDISKKEVSDKLALGRGTKYETVNYATVSWLYDLLRL